MEHELIQRKEADPKEIEEEDSPTANHTLPPRDARTQHHEGPPEDDEDAPNDEELVEHEEELFHFSPLRLSHLKNPGRSSIRQSHKDIS